MGVLSDLMRELPLVDGHCHTVLADVPTERENFEQYLTEADRPAGRGVSYGDSPLGLALRRWCPPVLDLPPGASLDDYLARRAELGEVEVRRRLLAAAKVSAIVVDTGLGGDGFTSVSELAESAGAQAHEVVRLETVAEALWQSGVDRDFADAYRDALSRATAHAVAVKSILAYRRGFDGSHTRPTLADVATAAQRWLSGPHPRLEDDTLLRFILWCGVDTGLPLQLHTGFGDRDLRLANANPVLLQQFCAMVEPTGTPIVLLHCYPYHREAAWLASVFPQVYVDIGLTVAHVGPQVRHVLAEFCELVPFGKLLYSSDAYALPELYLVGAAQFRHAFDRLLDDWLADGAVTVHDAERIATMVSDANARRLYGL
ncbi:MAG TPA: amidohydrolase family protein [Actinopolymorphaceae bacterium]